MPSYHRIYQQGGTYFFTVVTYKRQPILCTPLARSILHCTWKEVQDRYPFTTIAICLLPDHIHCIWELPEGDADYSTRWREIKRRFSHAYQHAAGIIAPRTESREKRDELNVWQRRFWAHLICDQDDLSHHIDYVHYNPVKHGYVTAVKQWNWSSFPRFVRDGYYPPEWGEMAINDSESGEFGE